MTPTFGDFLASAGEHIDAAIRCDDQLPAGAAREAIGELGRVITVLARFTGGFSAQDGTDPVAVRLLDARARAAADTTLALRQASANLRTAAPTPDAQAPAADARHPAACHLSGAADALAAGHDLLQTHFAPGPGGSRIGSSPWAPVIVAAPAGNALLAEVAACAQRLAPLAARLSQPSPAGPALLPAERLAAGTASQWLRAAATAAEPALPHHRPAGTQDMLLAAVPANTAPPRQPPHGGEPVSGLCAGTAICAERLRYLAPAFASRAHFPAAATSASWQRTAHAAAITGHASEPVLRALAGRATQLGINPAIAAGLNQAADATARAWAAWRDAARCWDTVTTGTRAPLAPVAAEIGDLVLWIGRIAHKDPHWTPAGGHTGALREAANLAHVPADIPVVLAAVHDAADAVIRVGACDREAIRAAAAHTGLFVPTRLLPSDYNVPRPFTPAPGQTIDALLASYDTAINASTCAATILDGLAIATGAPTRVLAAIRAAGQRGVPHLIHGPAPAADHAPRAFQHERGHVQRVLRSLDISEPALLGRAAEIDNATHDLIAEATAKMQRRDAAGSGSRVRTQRTPSGLRHPAYLAARDSPSSPAGRSPDTAGQAAMLAASPARNRPTSTPLR